MCENRDKGGGTEHKEGIDVDDNGKDNLCCG